MACREGRVQYIKWVRKTWEEGGGALQGEARGESIIEIFQASGGSQKLK